MHHLRSLLVLGGILLCAFVPAGRAVAESCSSAPSGGETVFSCVYGGEQSVTVPAGVTGLHVVAVGGAGSGDGGRGAIVTADLSVQPGQTLYVEVGGGADQNNHPGFNGGGQGGGGAWAGGGASDVRTCTVQPLLPQSCSGFAFGTPGTDPRLVVAGGGGGGGNRGSNTGGSPGRGGDAGLPGPASPGGDGTGAATGQHGHGGGGGDLTVGGPGGLGEGGGNGSGGAVANGGHGGDGGGSGGGGGGGLYGGGGGGAAKFEFFSPGGGGGGGGGGSSYGPAGATYALDNTARASVTVTTITPRPTAAG